MNVSKIQKLSKQICSLDTFHKRCLWSDVVLSISGHSLDGETSDLIKRKIHEIIDKQIERLKAEIKKEATNGQGE